MGEILLQLSQFGAAGLIGFLWVLERRHAAARERQLDEAHRQVMQASRDRDILIDVIRDNTRAIASLEGSQRQLSALLRGLALGRASRGCEEAAPSVTLSPEYDRC